MVGWENRSPTRSNTKKKQGKENLTPSESSIGKQVKYGCIEATVLEAGQDMIPKHSQ